MDESPSLTGAAGAISPPVADALPRGLAEHPDYQVIRELGRGGMGVVYLAHNRLMGRDEVLKVMSRHIMERPAVLARFLGEIRAVARLHHHNIVTAYAAIRLGETIVLAMEYVEGLDLARLVKAKGPLPVPNACSFVSQAAQGLQHAFEQGLVHRDIKPGNLMLSRAGDRATVKILDFGLAKATREAPVDGGLTNPGQALGTPDFMAPEQIRDATKADIRADIYSLGCTLYYLLSGAPPFRAKPVGSVSGSSLDGCDDLEPDPARRAGRAGGACRPDDGQRARTPVSATRRCGPSTRAVLKKVRLQRRRIECPALSCHAECRAAIHDRRSHRSPGLIVTSAAAARPRAVSSTAHEGKWDGLIDLREAEPQPASVTAVSEPTATRIMCQWPVFAAAGAGSGRRLRHGSDRRPRRFSRERQTLYPA